MRHRLGTTWGMSTHMIAIISLATWCVSATAQGQPCGFDAQPLHQGQAPIFLLAVGEIDPAHGGPEVLAVDADGVIVRLDRGDEGWSVRPLPISVEPSSIMHVRPTINIGDAHPGFPGNEIVVETFNTVSVLVQASPGQWQRQIVLDGGKFFGNVWGVRIGDIDPLHSGEELFYITESAFDVSAGWYAKPNGGQWQSRLTFQGEVGMDAAIGDSNALVPGNEIVVGTEMGPVYEITSQPGNPDEWRKTTLWNDFENAPWTLRIADILPQRPGNEIAYGSRYTDRLLISYRNGDKHEMEVVHTGDATEPMTMWDIAVGDVLPESAALEIVGVDMLGKAYLAWHDGSRWNAQTIWHDEGGALHAAIVGDFAPEIPGQEIMVAGESGAIVLITPQPHVAGDITCDGSVNVDDLLSVIGAWGPCPQPCPPSCDADVAPSPDFGGGNCTVDVDDLLLVIANWE